MSLSRYFKEDGTCIFHDNSEYKIVKFQFIHGDIIFLYGNTTFLKEFKLLETDFGNNIWELFEFEIAYAFSERCQFLRHHPTHLQFINSLTFPKGKIGIGIWSYTVTLEDNILTCVGQKEVQKKTGISRVENNIYRYYDVTPTNFFMFKLLKKDEDYVFITDDPLLLQRLGKKTLINEKLNPAFGLATATLLTSILNSCLCSHKIIAFQDAVRFREEIEYLDVQLIPSNFVKDEVLILAKLLSKEDYDEVQLKKGYIDTNYPANFTYGSCLINMEDYLFVEIANRQFYTFLTDCGLTVEDIMKLSDYTNAIEKATPITSTHIFKNCKGREGDKNILNLNFIPQFNEKKCIKMMIIITAEDTAPTLSKLLTKRELQIANYIALGRTNRYIAFELNVTEGTIKRTIHNIYQKLGISSRVELINHMYNS